MTERLFLGLRRSVAAGIVTVVIWASVDALLLVAGLPMPEAMHYWTVFTASAAGAWVAYVWFALALHQGERG